MRAPVGEAVELLGEGYEKRVDCVVIGIYRGIGDGARRIQRKVLVL